MRAAELIEAAYERRERLSELELQELAPRVAEYLTGLDRGELRSAYPTNDGWTVNTVARKAILLYFRTGRNAMAAARAGRPRSYDKLPLKFEDWDETEFERARLRVVPGAVVRFGAYVAPNAVLMPCFVNVGAYVGEGTMIDTWATVGSCAQVGARCHISGGAGIGGVLEPIGGDPVIVEDDVFVGARSEITEGVRIRRGAVIGMGVYLGRSTPIVDRATGAVHYGEVPENAVVVPGARASRANPGLSTYAVVIVKYADEQTRGKTALNDIVRE